MDKKSDKTLQLTKIQAKVMKVNRGDVWLVNLNSVRGHEQSGTRPALVVSDDMFNHSLAEMIIVVPITSKDKGIPTHI